jgi:hypothetical protein
MVRVRGFILYLFFEFWTARIWLHLRASIRQIYAIYGRNKKLGATMVVLYFLEATSVLLIGCLGLPGGEIQ